MFNLEGKTALVTGATGGIGQAIAKTLHQAGCTVIISGTKEHALQGFKDELKDNVYMQACNLSNEQEVENLIDNAENLSGKTLDILICNAGITKDGLAIRMKNEDFNQVLSVNLTASFILNRNALKKMMKQRWGRIINISSIVAAMGNPGQANYCASKAGLIGMSKSLACEAASRSVTVNCIAPGFIETPMTESLKPEQKERLLQLIPAGYFGTPQDVADCTAFLASPQARYITGQTIHVNGGMLMV